MAIREEAVRDREVVAAMRRIEERMRAFWGLLGGQEPIFEPPPPRASPSGVRRALQCRPASPRNRPQGPVPLTPIIDPTGPIERVNVLGGLIHGYRHAA